MKLHKMIKNKLKSLYKEYNIFNVKSTQGMDLMEKINFDSNEEEILLNMSLGEMNQLMMTLYEPPYNDIELIMERLRIIKVILSGKYERGFDIDLTPEQSKLLKDFIHDLRAQYNKIKKQQRYIEDNLYKKGTIEYHILELEDIQEKIINNEYLDNNDFDILYNLFINGDEYDYESKKELLLEFKNHNDNLSKDKSDEVVSFDELLYVFNKYGVNITLEELNEFKSEMVNADINEIENILSILQEEMIIKRFDKIVLLAICLYSDVEEVQERVEYIKEQNYRCNVIFHKPNLWVENLNSKMKKSDNLIFRFGNNSRHKSLYETTKGIGLQEIEENVRYLQSEGFDIDSNTDKNEKVLIRPNYLLRENVELYKFYGLLHPGKDEKFPLSALWFGDLQVKLDLLIEVGLLHGIKNDKCSNYVNNAISAINTTKNSIYPILYKLKQENTVDDYYETINSKGSNTFNNLRSLLNDFNIHTEDDLKQFINSNFINLDNSAYFQNWPVFKETINSYDRIGYDERVLNYSVVNILDNNYKKNEYVYEIGNTYISRIKVLRILSILQNGGINLDKESLMYALTYNMYINESTFNDIAQKIGYEYKGELKHGLSKEI